MTSEEETKQKKNTAPFSWVIYSLSNSTQEVKKKCAARIYFSGYNPGNREKFIVHRSARSMLSDFWADLEGTLIHKKIGKIPVDKQNTKNAKFL